MKIGDTEIHVRGRLVRIARLETDGIDFPSNAEAILRDVQKSGRPIDIVTFIQTMPHTQPQFSFPMEWDNYAVLPVSTFEHWWTKQIDFKVRNKARKGEKNGLSVREVSFDDTLVRGISGIYNESPVRQGKRFWHYGKDLDTVRRENGTFLDRSITIGAFLEERLVGFMKMVIAEDGAQASVIQILATIQHRDKAPTNALIAQAVRSCAQRKIPHLVYSNFAYGNKEDTLADFKRYNGFKRVDVPRYYVPLTVIGHAALRLGLHHELSERIPEPVLVHVRKARSVWYARRFQIPKEA